MFGYQHGVWDRKQNTALSSLEAYWKKREVISLKSNRCWESEQKTQRVEKERKTFQGEEKGDYGTAVI